MTWIGLPKTVPPKSSTAIRAAVTDPGPSAAEEGPDMSVSTPILTTSSETCALAGSAAAVDNAASATSHKRRMCSSLKCVLVKRRTLLPRRGSGARKRNIDPAPAFKCAAQESAAPPDRNERVAGNPLLRRGRRRESRCAFPRSSVCWWLIGNEPFESCVEFFVLV